jgi:hypothetical protein
MKITYIENTMKIMKGMKNDSSFPPLFSFSSSPREA